MKIQVRIPGKLMLSGEYAALKGGVVLATVLPLYLQVDLHSGPGPFGLDVTSDLWAMPKHFTLATLNDGARLDALHHALAQEVSRQPTLLDWHWTLKIQSDFPPSYGFGSSTALRLALHLGFAGQRRQAHSVPFAVLEAAKAVYLDQLDFQGRASGYDIYTQAMGQACLFQCSSDVEWPGASQTASCDAIPADLWAFVGGAGADTKHAIGSVTHWLDQNDLWGRLLSEQETLTQAFGVGGETLINAMGMVRQLFLRGPKGLPEMERLLAAVPGLDRTWSWKMTGAGGEDALLVYAPGTSFGPVKDALTASGWKAIPVPKKTAAISFKDIS